MMCATVLHPPVWPPHVGFDPRATKDTPTTRAVGHCVLKTLCFIDVLDEVLGPRG